MNKIVTGMYCKGATVSEIWGYLDGLLHYHEIEDILIDACLIQYQIRQVSERISAFFYALDTTVTNGKGNQTVKKHQTDTLITR